MSNYDFKLVIPKTKQPQQKPLYNPPTNAPAKQPSALFTYNTMVQKIGDDISFEDDIKLSELFREVDTEDIAGNSYKDEYGNGDLVLNKNEQRNFLQILKEKHPKLFSLVSRFIESIEQKSDVEKIANNLSLPAKDSNLSMNADKIINGCIDDLTNDNILEVMAECYKNGMNLLHYIYEEANERLEFNSRDLPKIEEYYHKEEITDDDIQRYEKLKNEYKRDRKKALKDLENLKIKCEGFANHLLYIASLNKIYTRDYEKDLEKAIENNDVKNLAIFTQRLADRVAISLDSNKTLNASKRAIETKEPNGEIDTNFVQGYTGDCWFLSALKSMCTDTDVLKEINYMITVNKDGDTITSVTVNIRGKEYAIDYENLKGANEYATGDLDVRALEMAVNQYMHENNLVNGDITLGGQTKDAYNLLFGEDNVEVIEYESNGYMSGFDSESFLNALKENKGNKIISNLGIYKYDQFFDEDDKLFAEDSNGNQVDLDFGHAYNYTKIDDKYLYFTDPRAPQKELRITLNRVGKVFDEAYIAIFKNNKTGK